MVFDGRKKDRIPRIRLKTGVEKMSEQIEQLKQLIIEGNRETNELCLPSESYEKYKYYWKKLIQKVEEITEEKIDFGYFYF